MELAWAYMSSVTVVTVPMEPVDGRVLRDWVGGADLHSATTTDPLSVEHVEAAGPCGGTSAEDTAA